MLKTTIFAFIALLVTAGQIAFADTVDASMDKVADVVFSEIEKQVIDRYFKKDAAGEQDATGESRGKSSKQKGKKSKKGMPPGLAKRDSLPPGLERQLQKNGTLPPGLAKKSLPAELEKELPPPPEGYERQVVEDAAVVLVEKATGKIADVIKGVIGATN